MSNLTDGIAGFDFTVSAEPAAQEEVIIEPAQGGADPAPTAEAAPEGDPAPAEEAELTPEQETIAAMRAEIDALKAERETPPAADSAEEEVNEEEQLQLQQPNFQFNIPENATNVLFNPETSPQEKSQVLGTLLTAAAMANWRHTQGQAEKVLLPLAQRQAQQLMVRQQASRQIINDFYTQERSHLNTPEARVKVKLAADSVTAEMKQAGQKVSWGPDLINKIVERTYALAPELKPQEKEEAPAPGKKAAQQFAPGAAARPAPAGTKTVQDEMVNVLNSGF